MQRQIMFRLFYHVWFFLFFLSQTFRDDVGFVLQIAQLIQVCAVPCQKHWPIAKMDQVDFGGDNIINLVQEI